MRFLFRKENVKDITSKFSILNCKHATTHMNINEKLQHEDGAKMADVRSFRSLVGGLIHLTHTPPDIVFPVGIISRFMQHISKVHYGAAKRVVRYVSGTLKYEIWYSKSSNFKLFGFIDSDRAGSLYDRQWRCQLQKQIIWHL